MIDFTIKRMIRIGIIAVLFYCGFSFTTTAQDVFIPLNHELNTRYEEFLARKDVKYMPSIKPYRADELRAYIPYDSLENDLTSHYYPRWRKEKHSWVNRKLFSEHLVDVNDTDSKFRLQVDFLFDFHAGYNRTEQPSSSQASKSTFTNTRGFQIRGDVGRKFVFYSGFYENQASFPYYLDSTIRIFQSREIVPGQGFVKETVTFGTTSFDYSLVNAGVSYTLNKHFNFTFAHDKNFLGDGYRSLLLSDNSLTYPFLRITADIWKIHYVSISAVMQDALARDSKNAGFRKKYSTFHYLLLGVGKTNRLTIGLFDGVIWAYDTVGGRGFDLAYLNPIIFLKPLEASMGSPDNGVLGFSLRYKLFNNLTLYGQVMLDEFKLSEVKAGNGWWANKQGFQVGFKTFNIAGVKHLNLQSEFNYVRPYTYSHTSTGTNYAQSNQALAHPLGANFMESVSFLRYNYKRWYFQGELMAAVIGYDKDSLDYGSNVFIPYTERFQEYGNTMAQGLRTTTLHETLTVAYLVNPATNMRVELGLDNRTTSNDYGNTSALYVTFGIKTALNNIYYDF